MLVDGVQQQVSFGSIIPVGKQFRINNQKGYRINVVGFTKPGYSNDGNFQIRYNQLKKSYSIDNAGQIYRVEVYRKERFSGMVLVDFRPESSTKESRLAQSTSANQIANERHY